DFGAHAQIAARAHRASRADADMRRELHRGGLLGYAANAGNTIAQADGHLRRGHTGVDEQLRAVRSLHLAAPIAAPATGRPLIAKANETRQAAVILTER